MDTDGILIARSVQGHPDAFVAVAQRHGVAIHGYLARRAGRQVADDLLADVWVRAFAARGGYDSSYDDARPWLYGIAGTCCGRTGGRLRTRLSPDLSRRWIRGMTSSIGSTQQPAARR